MSEPIVRGLPWKHVLYGMIENSAGILIHPEIDPETVPAVVHCVNCHDQLVAALESARKGFELITTAQSRGLSIHYAEGCAESCMEAAAAALAAAKEGA